MIQCFQRNYSVFPGWKIICIPDHIRFRLYYKARLPKQNELPHLGSLTDSYSKSVSIRESARQQFDISLSNLGCHTTQTQGNLDFLGGWEVGRKAKSLKQCYSESPLCLPFGFCLSPVRYSLVKFLRGGGAIGSNHTRLCLTEQVKGITI